MIGLLNKRPLMRSARHQKCGNSSLAFSSSLPLSAVDPILHIRHLLWPIYLLFLALSMLLPQTSLRSIPLTSVQLLRIAQPQRISYVSGYPVRQTLLKQIIEARQLSPPLTHMHSDPAPSDSDLAHSYRAVKVWEMRRRLGHLVPRL